MSETIDNQTTEISSPRDFKGVGAKEGDNSPIQHTKDDLMQDSNSFHSESTLEDKDTPERKPSLGYLDTQASLDPSNPTLTKDEKLSMKSGSWEFDYDISDEVILTYCKSNQELQIDVLCEEILKLLEPLFGQHDSKDEVDNYDSPRSDYSQYPSGLTPVLKDTIQKKISTLNEKLKTKYLFWKEHKTLEKLGPGTLGELEKVFDPFNRKFYTRRILPKGDMPLFDEQVMKELRVLVTIIKREDPMLARIYSIEYIPEKSFTVLMERGRGTLKSYNEFRKYYELDWKEWELNNIANRLFFQMKRLRCLGIYHRDIKPENIIISEGGHLKLVDFGFAEIIPEGTSENVTLIPVGSPEYMAPNVREAFEESKLVTCDIWKAEIYSFGKTMESLIDWAKKDEIGEFEKKVEFILQEQNYVPEAELYNLIVLQEEFEKKEIEGLFPILINRPLEPQLLDMLDSPMLEEYKALINKKLKELEDESTEQPLRKAELLIQLAAAYSFSEDYKEALLKFQKALDLQLKHLGMYHKDVATTYNHVGSMYYQLGNHKSAMFSHQKALEIQKKALPKLHLDIAYTRRCMSYVLSDLHETEEAMEGHEESLQMKLKLLPPGHPDIAASYDSIGALHFEEGDFDEALMNYQTALDIRLKALIPSHPDVAHSYSNIANIYFSKGEYRTSLEYYRKALDIHLVLNPETNPNVASLYNNLGNIYSEQAKYEEALECYRRALDIQLRVFGPNHPDVAGSYNNIGSILANQGNHQEALEYYEAAIFIRLKIFGDTHPDSAASYNNIGNVHSDLGNYEEALKNYAEAIDIQLKYLGLDHPSLAISYNNIGSAFFYQGDFEEALRSYKKALEIQTKLYGKNHPDVAITYSNMADVYAKFGNYQDAIQYYERALAIQQKVFDPTHHAIGVTYKKLGIVKSQMNKYDEAVEHLKKALEIKLKEHGESSVEVAHITELIEKYSNVTNQVTKS